MAEKSEALESFKDLVSSLIGSAACVYTGQPFDTVKVRMQTASPGEFAGNIDAIRKVYKSEGLLRMWAGSIPALTGAVSENAVAFTLNGSLKRLFGDKDTADKPFWEPFATGAITGFVTAFVLCPTDVIKCRAQVFQSKGLPAKVTDVIRYTLRTEGFKGFYVGMFTQFARELPFYASFFGSYDTICSIIKHNTTWSEPVVYATAGGLAGQIAWVCSIVPDAVKSVIQTAHPKDRLKFWPTLHHIVRTRGVYRGLFAGIEVAVVRAYPANAALFVGYEYTKKGLDKFTSG